MIASHETDDRQAWAREVVAILAAMPTRQAHALRLHYFEQLSESEVAVRMGELLEHSRSAAAEGLLALGQALVAGPILHVADQ